MANNNFVHLHQHSVYSFLDGYNKIENLTARVKELGQTATALTDHNNLAGIPLFLEECERNNIKPLLGVESYFTPDITQASLTAEERKKQAEKRAVDAGAVTLEQIEQAYSKSTRKGWMTKKELKEITDMYMYDMKQFHILFIAKNQIGWNNLVKLQSEAARLCTYNGRYLCDYSLIEKYHEGIIATTACIGSFPAQQINRDNENEAKKYIKKMKKIFDDDFYLEIQPLNEKEQWNVNYFYYNIAKEMNIEVVATNDVHWTYKEDHDDHDTLLCIGTAQYKTEAIARQIWERSKTKTKEFEYKRMRYAPDFWIRSRQEMEEAFIKQQANSPQLSILGEEYVSFYTAALDNTVSVADKVETGIKIGSDKPLFPKVKVPYNLSPEDYLEMIAYKGLYKYLAEHPECDRKTYEKRIREELDVINPKGFAPYMLMVREYTTWADNNGIAVGPGRGSAAGSLVLFCIGITKNIDPIKYKLWFSRFLTADRKDPPDIDLDFDWENRDRVIEHLEDYYGKDHVAHIGTYTTLGVKNGISDVSRCLGEDFGKTKNITKVLDEINNTPGIGFKDYDAMANGNEQEQELWKKFNELEKSNKEIFRLARAFEGIPRNTGVHASGILVTPEPIINYFPIHYVNGIAVTFYTGPQCEHFGTIKLDVLGLKTLSVIKKTLNNIDSSIKYIDFCNNINISDPKLYKYLADKNTDCVFQLESNMMKGIVDVIKPTNFEDIVVISSVGRPGPMSVGMHTDYANRMHGKEDVDYPIKGCEDILKDTYGTIPYQELLMAISKRIAGFNDMQADSLTRKTVAKKKLSMMPMLIRCHIYGKKNCEGPEGWETNDKLPWYDPKEKYGAEIEGAVNRGYTEEEVLHYFKVIEKYSSYCFNRSHSVSYSFITLATAYLKYYYPTEYMAAVLSMAADDKVANYTGLCEKSMNISVSAPDINKSKADFTPADKKILYGLGSIKRIGATSLPDLIANAPYESLEDALKRIPKKAFNKTAAENLIKAGAFDFQNNNRYELLNELHKLRKDKIYEEYDISKFDDKALMEMEKEVLGAYITVKPWWESLLEGKTVTVEGYIAAPNERVDKKGNTMAFPDLRINGCKVPGMIFASKYLPIAETVRELYTNKNFKFKFTGKKNDRNTFQLDCISLIQ